MPHILDIIIAIPLVWALYRGYKKGLVIELTTLAALIVGLLGAVHLSSWTADIIIQTWEIDGKVIPILSFAVTFIALVIGVHLIGRAIQKLVKLVALGTVNRIGGALFRSAKVLLIISVGFNLLNSIQEDWGLIPPELKEESVLYEPLSDLAPIIVPAIQDNRWYTKIKDAFPSREDIPGLGISE